MNNKAYILAIESSCDDTSIAVLLERKILSNVVANQAVHAEFGGVVPELASRAHQQNIIPTAKAALTKAGVSLEQIAAIAYTQGPGLLGSLLVGSSFAKGLSLGMNIPLLEVNHMQAHILAHFIEDNASQPEFPFLCLTVSGGHTQIVLVRDYLDMEILGQTIDDAAGEAFDKAAKMLGLPYPGGPLIDKHAKNGDGQRFAFKAGKVGPYDFSFSGLKTNILYFLKKEVEKNPSFIEDNRDDLCASIQKTIVDELIKKLLRAAKDRNIRHLAIAGGVSANSSLRSRIMELQDEGFFCHIPKFEYCTDNAAMIAIVGHFKLAKQDLGSMASTPKPRLHF